MRRLLAASICILLFGWALTTPSASAAPGPGPGGTPRCAGEKATLVGKPGGALLRGTKGRDVIVTNGVQRVNADSGPDLICATGTLTRDVLARAGDDRVLVPNGRSTYLTIQPGDGDDHVVGGKSRETVNQVGAHGRDTLRLGPGNDLVTYAPDRPAAQTQPRDNDRVYLGAGDDVVSQSFPSERAIYEGGAGRDGWDLFERVELSKPIQAVDVDLAAGTVRVDNRLIRVRSFDDLSIGVNRSAEVTYLGNENDNVFWSFPAPTSARMLGGDDELFAFRGTPEHTVDGGSGVDLLGFTSGINGIDSITADLVAGTATAMDGDDTWTFAVSGFENAKAHATEVRIIGTDAPNIFLIEGCDVQVDAGGGDDIVRWNRIFEDPFIHCELSPGAQLNGEEGDDRLIGGFLNDTLIGGPGDDHADGDTGQDSCEAETRIDCES